VFFGVWMLDVGALSLRFGAWFLFHVVAAGFSGGKHWLLKKIFSNFYQVLIIPS